MTGTTYATLMDSLEAAIYGILSTDSTIITTLDAKVLADEPANLSKGIGLPYLIVSQKVSEDPLAFGGASTTSANESKCTVIVDVWSYKAATNRKLVDAIRAAVQGGQATMRTVKFHLQSLNVSDVRPVNLPNNGNTQMSHVYSCTVNVEYSWTGLN